MARLTRRRLARLTRRRFAQRAMLGASTSIGGASFANAMTSQPPTEGARMGIREQDDRTEIDFYHIWGTPAGTESSGPRHPVEQIVDAFNEQSTSVRVTSRTDGGTYYDVLRKTQAQLAAGDPPALVITAWSNIHYADEGLGIIDLEDVAGEDAVSEAFSVLREQVLPLVQINGKTKGVPFAFSCPVVYYNNDVMKDAGVDPEELLSTWDQFAQEASSLQAHLSGGPVFGFGTVLDWQAQSIIQSNGGRVLTDEGHPVMDSPEAIGAMEFIADLDSQGLYDRSSAKEAQASFIGGSIPLFMGSIASLGNLSRSVNFDLQTAPFPTFGDKPRQMSSGGSFIGLYARDEQQQQAAWEFLKFTLTEEAYGIWMQTGYLNPTTYDLPILDGQEAAYTELREGLTGETPWPGARGGEIQDIWRDYVTQIWSNVVTAEEGCRAAVKEIETQLD